MPETRSLYAKADGHSVAIGGTAEATAFAKSAAGGEWVPTVINPSDGSRGMVDRALFYIHLAVWIAALLLGCITNFTVGTALEKNASYVPCTSVGVPDNCGGNSGLGEGYPTTWASDNVKMIGVLGSISSILGVLLLLASAAWLTADGYRGTVWVNALIQFLTLFGTTSTFYIFSKAATVTTTGYFWLSLFAVVLLTYSQVLLYCTSAALDVLALPRAFIPSLATSVQLVSAIAVSSGDFKDANGAEFTDSQKTVAWLVPALTLAALILMVGLRRLTRRESDSVSQLGDRPFLRSLVLAPFLASALLSVYKLSFIAVSSDATAYMFSILGMLLNFTIVSVVFTPGGGAFAADLQ